MQYKCVQKCPESEGVPCIYNRPLEEDEFYQNNGCCPCGNVPILEPIYEDTQSKEE